MARWTGFWELGFWSGLIWSRFFGIIYHIFIIYLLCIICLLFPHLLPCYIIPHIHLISAELSPLLSPVFPCFLCPNTYPL
ncbi:hypothetical protein BDV23DRAFT_59782 [Aspergillus alliaceus]|uniref:Uncharacterized protein n=1 Tax=Petromyces alliaceus TaxID=209559 RepID=A0A5N7CCZ8_PETAA|nr:hypothetical protein BDV23DRAFT_59782 [Aspergillus alliaceus]